MLIEEVVSTKRMSDDDLISSIDTVSSIALESSKQPLDVKSWAKCADRWFTIQRDAHFRRP
jgi:hypothetical protein